LRISKAPLRAWRYSAHHLITFIVAFMPASDAAAGYYIACLGFSTEN
jgi:hypothetical protein